MQVTAASFQILPNSPFIIHPVVDTMSFEITESILK